jgi:hypothetical protein
MAVENIHSFLVHPAKHVDDQPPIRGAEIPLRDRLYEMLADIFDRASDECKIEICFCPDTEGVQRNECREELLTYLSQPTVPNGRTVAARLQSVTTHRSGLGLFFLIGGRIGGDYALVISRFPADQAIMAEESGGRLAVEFVERVFMRNARAYKSVFYQTSSLDAGFWDGRAVDRQISGAQEVSEYWISDFLLSQLRTTSKAGTKRLARAIRDAVKSTDELVVRQELIAATTLLRGQAGRRRSAAEFLDRLDLTEPAVQAIITAFPRSDLVDEVFEFDLTEFDRQVQYRAVELDNGGILIAQDEQFDQVFRKEQIRAAEGRVRYTTEGRVVDEMLRKRR